MNTDQIVLFIGVIILGALALLLAFWLIRLGLVGAIFLLGFAAEQGFVGLAVYVACWVFLFPVMIIACLIVGYMARNEN